MLCMHAGNGSARARLCASRLPAHLGHVRAAPLLAAFARAWELLSAVCACLLWLQVTPVVEELCQPVLPNATGAAPLTSTANISRFVLIYDDAPGALRALCDKLLQEWLSALAEAGDVATGAAAAEIRLLFHQLLDLLLDPDQNECASDTVALVGTRPRPACSHRALRGCMGARWCTRDAQVWLQGP
jgi:hypothetical protein